MRTLSIAKYNKLCISSETFSVTLIHLICFISRIPLAGQFKYKTYAEILSSSSLTSAVKASNASSSTAMQPSSGPRPTWRRCSPSSEWWRGWQTHSGSWRNTCRPTLPTRQSLQTVSFLHLDGYLIPVKVQKVQLLRVVLCKAEKTKFYFVGLKKLDSRTF